MSMMSTTALPDFFENYNKIQQTVMLVGEFPKMKPDFAGVIQTVTFQKSLITFSEFSDTKATGPQTLVICQVMTLILLPTMMTCSTMM